ncbi:hypothetical protein BKA64DRAFT_641820 [Cadophora sp. MPI-SDFR-AT-0126]|nr:hypothetical protein BKA64DRAFT_641820 [Leotiomycetes sp. MPI-SDFR-AT-0126]
MAETSISTNMERLALSPTTKKKITLDSDIWYLVFAEYMSQAAFHAWLHDTRLVSHEFNVIVKRHAYEFIDLSQTSFMNRLTRVTTPPCEEVKNNIRQNTKTLELSPDRHFRVKEVTVDFMSTCVNLQRVMQVSRRF